MGSLKNNQGFTLIELMVAVGIVGLLGAIALPQYQAYQARGRQTEVKVRLAAIYTAEQTAVGELNTYGSCFRSLGLVFSNTGKKSFYTLGFDDSVAEQAKCGPGDLVCNFVRSPTDGQPIVPGVLCPKGNGNTVFVADNALGGTIVQSDAIHAAPNAGVVTTISANAFTVGGLGFIGYANVDAWTMDQFKTLTQTRDGLQ